MTDPKHPPNRPVAVGEQITFRITARNRGTAAATNVSIRLKIPASLEWVGARGGVKYTRTGNEIAFSPLTTIAAGAKAGFDVVLKARSKGDVRVGVQIQSAQMTRPLNREEAVLIIPASQ